MKEGGGVALRPKEKRETFTTKITKYLYNTKRMRAGTEGDKRMAEQAEVPVSLGDKYRFQLKTKGLKGTRKGEIH